MIATVLEDVSIVDGTGRPRYTTDVALADDRIAIVGDCSGREARRRLACRGSVIAPGFIDACSHTGGRWLTLPASSSKLQQGVTTEITCVAAKSLHEDWEESLCFEDFLALTQRAAYEANGSFFADENVRHACETGAAGVAIDFAKMRLDDAIARATEAAAGGAPRAHVALRDYGSGLLAALDDALALAHAAPIHVHLAHVHTSGRPGTMERLLERVDRARSSGASISCDIFPYVATWIALTDLLPRGIEQPTLSNEAVAAAAALEMQARLGDIWHDLILASVSSEEHLAWCGMRFDDIARHMRLSPARALIRLALAEGTAARAFQFSLREDDVAMALTADFCAIGSSAPAYAPGERIFGAVHPRAYGSFARVARRFVRQRKTLTLEEAIRRMTDLPARIFGLEGRGRIVEGAYADLVVFDERDFADTATYAEPYSLPAGMRYAFVRGHTVLGGRS